MSDIKTENMWLMKGDCLERMKEIPSGSVDMVLAVCYY
jgi:DNA modification methylase